MTACGAIEMPLGITNKKLKSTLARVTEHEHVVELHATVVDTTAYDVILGMEFVAAVRGAYDSYTEKFTYRWTNGGGDLRSHSILAPCHASTPPVIAYACFSELISNAAELLDVADSDEDAAALEDDWGYHTSPLQLAAVQLSNLAQACEAADMEILRKEVRGHDQTRRDNAAERLVAITPLSLSPILPTSSWIGGEVMGAFPINTATRRIGSQAIQDGLHVLELFGGIGLGVLRSTLAAGYVVRCYTYVDKDPVSRRIARAVLQSLQQQYPTQLSDAAIQAFDKRLPQNVSLCSSTLLT